MEYLLWLSENWNYLNFCETEKYFIRMGIVSRDSFACLKTENILFTMKLFALGYLCAFLAELWNSFAL